MTIGPNEHDRMLPDPHQTYPGNPLTLQFQGPMTDELRDFKDDYALATGTDAGWKAMDALLKGLRDPIAGPALKRILAASPNTALEIYRAAMAAKRAGTATKPSAAGALAIAGRRAERGYVTKPVTNQRADVTNVTADVTNVTKRALTPAERKRAERMRKKDE